MGYRPYRGPVRTLEQAMFADMPVQVVCGVCRHFRQLHAFKLIRQIGDKVDGRKLLLWERIDSRLWEVSDIVKVVEEWEATQA